MINASGSASYEVSLAIAFIIAVIFLCIASVMAIFGITHVYMSGPEAVERDGLYRGASAPKWSLTDSSGKVLSSPPSKPFQLIIFTDHSLKSFPSVIDGLHMLLTETSLLDTVILLQRSNEIAEQVLRMIGLEEIPVLTGSSALYGRYNVRVTPFMIFVDSQGRVRASSLVNHAWQVEKLWRIANVPLAEGPQPPVSRSWWRPARLGA